MYFDLLDYDLPPCLIAQEPCPERGSARLLVVHRGQQRFEHRHVFDLPDLLSPGDLVVLNDTRVLPARLVGRRAATGGNWEGLFLQQRADGSWEVLSQTRGRLRSGEVVEVLPGGLRLTVLEQTPDRTWLVQPQQEGSAEALLDQYGQVPLPPYIRKGQATPADRERYQTVYARNPGAVAAPTAGLHFTPQLLEALRQRGIEIAYLTLHVGLGTFRPLQTADVRAHVMHRESGELPAACAQAIAACKQRQGQVVAVGTTTVRVLETVAASGPPRPWRGETDLFIYPPYHFGLVDALLTNFHLPRTTLLLLVAAFAGVDLTRQAYKTAVEQRYRFYSYGDAMLVL